MCPLSHLNRCCPRLLEFLTGREGREMAARADFPALRRALLCHLAALLTHGLVQPMDMHRYVPCQPHGCYSI